MTSYETVIASLIWSRKRPNTLEDVQANRQTVYTILYRKILWNGLKKRVISSFATVDRRYVRPKDTIVTAEKKYKRGADRAHVYFTSKTPSQRKLYFSTQLCLFLRYPKRSQPISRTSRGTRNQFRSSRKKAALLAACKPLQPAFLFKTRCES